MNMGKTPKPSDIPELQEQNSMLQAENKRLRSEKQFLMNLTQIRSDEELQKTMGRNSQQALKGK